MDSAAKERLKLLNADCHDVSGHKPRRFYCPILYRDDDVELCKAHIINESFPDSDRQWTIQRADVDNWFGSMFEADFIKLQHRQKLKASEVLADPKLAKQFRPKFSLDGKDVDHYTLASSVPDHFSPILVEHELGSTGVVLKISPNELLEARDKKWSISFEVDLQLPALVSLLKAAHLTLFHQAGYAYALSAGGHFIGRTVLGDFFQRAHGLPRADVQREARSHFGKFRNLVRPIVTRDTDLKGTMTDGLFYVCRYHDGYWATKILVRTGGHLHAVLLPVFDQTEPAARFISFLEQSSVRFEALLARWTEDGIEMSPTSQQFEWPEAKLDLP